jgi:hypothetical protein
MNMNETLNQTSARMMTVTVSYRLSVAGQRAALIAGKPATDQVTEDMEFSDMSYLDAIHIDAQGKLSLNTVVVNYISTGIRFDAPPTLAELIAAFVEEKATQVAKAKLRLEAEQEADRQRKAKDAQKRVDDFPIVKEALELLRNTAPLEDTPSKYRYCLPFIYDKAGELYMTNEQREELKSLFAIRKEAKEAEERAKEAAKQSLIEQKGGYWWAPAKFHGLLGYGVWHSGQTKRWVGTFSSARGIDEFLPNPKGEFVFDFLNVKPGTCVQAGGFDTNSRGKRRDESEFFGVVIVNDESGLVIKEFDRRANALAHKM